MTGPGFVALTCDLVDSKEQPDRAELQRQLEAALRDANTAFAGELAVPLSITLGDEWQGLLRSVEAALRLDFALRRALHPVRLRSGLGAGALTSELRERTALMDGPCFHRSRAALQIADEMAQLGGTLATSSNADATFLAVRSLEKNFSPAPVTITTRQSSSAARASSASLIWSRTAIERAFFLSARSIVTIATPASSGPSHRTSGAFTTRPPRPGRRRRSRPRPRAVAAASTRGAG